MRSKYTSALNSGQLSRFQQINARMLSSLKRHHRTPCHTFKPDSHTTLICQCKIYMWLSQLRNRGHPDVLMCVVLTDRIVLPQA